MNPKNFIAIMVLLVMGACAGGEQERSVEIDTPQEIKEEKKKIPEYADASFKDGMVESAFQYYLKIQQALVQSDDQAVRNAAENLAEDFTEKHQELKDLAHKMSETESLEEQRKDFEKLTTTLEPILRNSIVSGEIYKQYCPMAFNDKGAYWISETKEIRNPYFGEKMLKCGSTKDTITKK